MSTLKYEFEGNRGKHIKVYDRKVEITTKVSAGSVLTGNATDGTKIVFFTDVVGVQYKEPGLAIGYLQFETPGGQMNNEKSNFWAENTFTFEYKNGLTQEIFFEMRDYILERLEEIKFDSVSNSVLDPYDVSDILPDL